MLEGILPWIGGIFAGLGVIFLFIDIFNSIRYRNRRALNVIGLIVLSIGVVGYVLTDIVFRGIAPSSVSVVWIVLFWVYVLLAAIGAICSAQDYKRAKIEAEKRAKREARQAVINELHAQRNKERAKVVERKERERAKVAERKAKEKAKLADRREKEKARIAERKANEKNKIAERKANEKAKVAERKAQQRLKKSERKAKEKAKLAERKSKQRVKKAARSAKQEVIDFVEEVNNNTYNS